VGEKKSSGSLIDLLNGSGFPFQIGVKEQINATNDERGWSVVAEEHPWKDSNHDKDDYIDLIAEWNRNVVFRLVIECKRVNSEAKWIFLTPRGSEIKRGRLSAFWVGRVGLPGDKRGWIDLMLRPDSAEAAFCTIHRESDTNRPMVERIADKLLPAVEAVGVQEQVRTNRFDDHYGQERLLVPMIVTNATLFTATFGSENVSMESGCISPSDCETKVVPFVRFRKSLWTGHERSDLGFHHISHENLKDPLTSVSRASERTILVVNASALAQTLESFYVDLTGVYSFPVLLQRLTAL
jgi:hypothetical protein